MLGAAKLLRDVQVERLGAAAALGALWAPRPRQSHDPRQINAYDRAVTPFLARYYSEREISEIVWFVGSKHLQNVTNIGLNIYSDMLYIQMLAACTEIKS